jgi:hypothetical protein
MALRRWLLRMWIGLHWLTWGLMVGFGISTVKLCILHDVPGFQLSTAVFDCRGNSESDMSYIYIYIYIYIYMWVWFAAVPELWIFTINWIKQKIKKYIVHSLRPCVISGFCHGVSEVTTFLECGAALVGSYRRFDTGCWYQNVGNYQSTLCNTPGEWRPYWG